MFVFKFSLNLNIQYVTIEEIGEYDIANFPFTLFPLSQILGYFITSTDVYDIKWTMPHCVLTLRLTGVAIDLYDGAQNQVW